MAVVLAMFALTIAVYAAGLAWAVHRRTTRRSESEAEGLPEDLVGLRHEVAALGPRVAERYGTWPWFGMTPSPTPAAISPGRSRWSTTMVTAFC